MDVGKCGGKLCDAERSLVLEEIGVGRAEGRRARF